jgi:ABC-type phosphate transport system substrate-binding protein
MRRLRSLSALSAAALVAGLVAITAPSALAATPGASSHETITGAGTSWSYIALADWINAVADRGLVVDYNTGGSAGGRQEYMQGGQVDFAGSDSPFWSGPDKLAGNGAEIPEWGYSYVPDVAGGTAFMYHLTVGGKLVRNLRLSPLVLMEIFTGAITNWDNPAITKVYGHQLPNLAITPVLHSEGDGTTFFFTTWLASMFPAQWNSFCDKVHPGIKPPCGATEYYPQFGRAKMENGSNNVADYITSSSGDGSIGLEEDSYALASDYPVVSVLNADGKFVQPTAANVTTALTKAVINENPKSKNFLQQNLSRVYTNKAPGSYPLASYSYLIVPREGTKIPPVFNDAAGATLSAFLSYGLCKGQDGLVALGYAPLPANLVKGALKQVGLIPGHGTVPTSCPSAKGRS